jgi:hypothetical protein
MTEMEALLRMLGWAFNPQLSLRLLNRASKADSPGFCPPRWRLLAGKPIANKGVWCFEYVMPRRIHQSPKDY